MNARTDEIDLRILPSRVPSRTLWVGKLIVPLVDSKETSGAKTESADGRSRKRNNLKKLGVMMIQNAEINGWKARYE